MGLQASCKDQVHATLAKLGVPVTCSDIFGTAGSARLDGLRRPQPNAGKVTSLRRPVGELSTEITMLSEVTADLLAGDRGYQVIRHRPGARRGYHRRDRGRALVPQRRPAVQLGRADPAAPRVRHQDHPPGGCSP